MLGPLLGGEHSVVHRTGLISKNIRAYRTAKVEQKTRLRICPVLCSSTLLNFTELASSERIIHLEG